MSSRMPRVSPFLATLLAFCACATGVQAQGSGQASRPFRGIFGGSDSSSQSRNGLDLMFSLFQAYDDDVTSQGGGSSNPQQARQAVGGYSSTAQAGLDFRRMSERLSFTLSADSTAQYYPDLDDLLGVSHQGAAALGVTRGRFGLRTTQSAAYSPFYSFRIRPAAMTDLGAPAIGLTSGPQGEFGVFRQQAWSYQSNVNSSYELTSRTSVDGSFGWDRRQLEDTATVSDWSGSGSLRREFTRYLSLSLGYGYQQASYEATAARRRPIHNINIGTNYNRPLSRTRRTTMSFSTGTLIAEERQGRVYHMVGQAGLRHHMGRTWSALLDYDRTVKYVEAFMEPFFGDSVSVSTQGFLSRRLDVNAQAAYTNGLVGLTAGAPRFRSVSVMSRLRLALTRTLALTGRYTYQHYNFEEQPALLHLPSRFDRHGLRVGIMLYLPLSDRARS